MKIDSIVKSVKRQLFIAIVLIIISVCCYVGAAKVREEAGSKTAKSWDSLIAAGSDNAGEFVTVTTPYVPYQFGEKEEDDVVSKYYLIIDMNMDYYVVRLTDATYNEMKSQYDDKGDSFSYELKGYLYETPSELKKLVVDTFNEEADSGLTLDNYNDYIGKCYLDETATPYDDTVGIIYAIGFVLDFVAIILVLVFIGNNSRIKKSLSKYDKRDIEEEIGKETSVFYKKLKLYVTDKYLVSFADGVSVVEYSDIYWAYVEKLRYRGITTGKYVILITKDKKRVQIASTVRDENVLNEVITKISEKNNEVLIGFTPENQKAFAEFKKNK